jgi:hypothetical protein
LENGCDRNQFGWPDDAKMVWDATKVLRRRNTSMNDRDGQRRRSSYARRAINHEKAIATVPPRIARVQISA